MPDGDEQNLQQFVNRSTWDPMALQWRLFLPENWASDTARRGLARIPADITHREERRLALGMLDTPADWGLGPPTVVADTIYGTNAPLRTALSERGLAYVLAVGLGPEAVTPLTWRHGPKAAASAVQGRWDGGLPTAGRQVQVRARRRRSATARFIQIRAHAIPPAGLLGRLRGRGRPGT
ncbi:transposase [Streptomyces sp. NPDC059467]|uniref:transposase n=1 Tax=Streptomyces sp. NPDC059467 TaxID=3346844 RepID=UPI0036C45D9E